MSSLQRCVTGLGLALLVVAVPRTLTAQAQSLAGTWTMNAAKSKFEPADLALKSSTATYTFSGSSVSASIDQVNAKGQKVHVEYTATLDGKDSPWKGTIDGKPNTNQDATTFKKLDANTYHVESKLKGKVFSTIHIVVAADGKSRTSTTDGTNAEGKKVHNVVVYDKK